VVNQIFANLETTVSVERCRQAEAGNKLVVKSPFLYNNILCFTTDLTTKMYYLATTDIHVGPHTHELTCNSQIFAVTSELPHGFC